MVAGCVRSYLWLIKDELFINLYNLYFTYICIKSLAMITNLRWTDTKTSFEARYEESETPENTIQLYVRLMMKVDEEE